MFRLTFLLAFTPFWFAYHPLAAEQPAAKEWVSPDAWIVAEITRPDVLLDRALSDDVVATVTSLTAYKEALATPEAQQAMFLVCLLYTSPSPRDRTRSRMPSSA